MKSRQIARFALGLLRVVSSKYAHTLIRGARNPLEQLQFGMGRSSKEAGFAVPITLLLTSVALMAAVGAALVAAVSARQVASHEQRSTLALLAAESGLNAVVALSNTAKYDFPGGSVESWLQFHEFNSMELLFDSSVELNVFNIAGAPDRVTIQAIGKGPDDSVRVVYQDFSISPADTADFNPHEGALVTKPPLETSSSGSEVHGIADIEPSWIFTGYEARQARVGDYLDYLNTRYVVDEVSAGGNDLMVRPVPSADAEPVPLAGTAIVDLIPWAVTFHDHQNDVSLLGVSDPTGYVVGSEIRVGTGVGVVTEQREDALMVNWTVNPGASIPEGTPVRKEIPSVVADEEGCPVAKNDNERRRLAEKLPQGCQMRDLDTLFEDTFPGFDKTGLRDFFLDPPTDFEYATQVYTNDTSPSWPSAPVSGLTWIDGASTGDFNSGSLCGDGIVILNTGTSLDDPTAKINLNVSDCDFHGILYVLGEVSIAGNLSRFHGSIIVEGPGKVTSVQGTGQGDAKLRYDPIAVRGAREMLSDYLGSDFQLTRLPKTWRMGQ